ncbi:MAG: hypothetical protein E7180_06020 [Erysipelotrichaceae bacterium]|nr:hypothetical protein [Erysipelotrichaceae bacterium]
MKKFYKILSLFLGFCFIFTLLNKPISAHADMGPKPAVDVTLKNLDKDCYITLLSSREQYGPYFSYFEDESVEDLKQYYASDLSDEVFMKFVNYQDKDNYYFLCYAAKLTPNNNQFRWGYYPPEPFKILIYFEDTDSFISSEIMERYAFKSYYEIDMSKNVVDGSLDVVKINGLRKSYDYGGEILALLVRMALTIGVELLIALLFMLKSKKLFAKVAIVNVVTQILLNVVLNINYFYNGGLSYIILYFPLELGVIIIESIAFMYIFNKDDDVAHPVLLAISYAIIANLISFGVGLLLATYLPFAF